ncbi:uncharacterized protein LOC141578927 [Camelus bactrianus]|uniref:Uncharacterized protein LOC141578927 n=1 Tax=Camelus bactrianus TaxID=9837 RepID=A0AC58R3G8_CAMBA
MEGLPPVPRPASPLKLEHLNGTLPEGEGCSSRDEACGQETETGGPTTQADGASRLPGGEASPPLLQTLCTSALNTSLSRSAFQGTVDFLEKAHRSLPSQLSKVTDERHPASSHQRALGSSFSREGRRTCRKTLFLQKVQSCWPGKSGDGSSKSRRRRKRKKDWWRQTPKGSGPCRTRSWAGTSRKSQTSGGRKADDSRADRTHSQRAGGGGRSAVGEGPAPQRDPAAAPEAPDAARSPRGSPDAASGEVVQGGSILLRAGEEAGRRKGTDDLHTADPRRLPRGGRGPGPALEENRAHQQKEVLFVEKRAQESWMGAAGMERKPQELREDN